MLNSSNSLTTSKRNYPNSRKLTPEQAANVRNKVKTYVSRGKFETRAYIIRILDMILDSDYAVLNDIEEFKQYLAEEFGINVRSAYRYIRSALDAIYHNSLEKLEEVRAVHIADYDDMYQEARLNGDLQTALRIRQAAENLLGWNRPHIMQQILINNNVSMNPEDEYKNWSVEDLNTHIALMEKYEALNQQKDLNKGATGIDEIDVE